MATIKVKFRQSTVNPNEGKIYYQVTHNRVVRVLKTKFKIYSWEWSTQLESVVLPNPTDERYSLLCQIHNLIEMDMLKMKSFLSYYLNNRIVFNIDEFVDMLRNNDAYESFFMFMRRVIEQQSQLGNIRRKEIYTTTMNSLMRFCSGRDLSFGRINAELIRSYELYLKDRVSSNTSSFYMRNLRAVYNMAVEQEIIPQGNPFKYVYTGVERTTKRAVPLAVIKRLKGLPLDNTPELAFARDMFLFSFYTRGMSFIDMAFLRKKDLSKGVLTYRRKKTGQKMVVKWETCMQEIVKRYTKPKSQFLLPIIDSKTDPYNKYRNVSSTINSALKLISRKLRLKVPLTMYVARHAWASIAKSKNIPLSVISEGMGHDSETTTRIYLATLDTCAVDRANRTILNLL